mgnify:CR=1 FL=1
MSDISIQSNSKDVTNDRILKNKLQLDLDDSKIKGNSGNVTVGQIAENNCKETPSKWKKVQKKRKIC